MGLHQRLEAIFDGGRRLSSMHGDSSVWEQREVDIPADGMRRRNIPGSPRFP